LTGKDAADWPAHVLAEQISQDGKPSRMIRKGRWKLNWFSGREVEIELFNVGEDPEELRNRADDPSCADVINTLLDDIRADGWSPERILAVREARKDDYKYICDWAAKVTPQDTIQWGVAAPL
jgi:arylsulfatase A-like enzyme